MGLGFAIPLILDGGGEVSGLWADISGNEHHLIPEGTPTAVDGLIGNSAKAAGTETLQNSDAELGNAESAAFAFDGFFRRAELGAASETPILLKAGEYSLTKDSADKVTWEVATTGGSVSVTSAVVLADEESRVYFYVDWQNSTRIARISINDSALESSTAGDSDSKSGTSPFTMLDSDSRGAESDEKGHWRRTLTAAERTKRYRGGLGRRPALP